FVANTPLIKLLLLIGLFPPPLSLPKLLAGSSRLHKRPSSFEEPGYIFSIPPASWAAPPPSSFFLLGFLRLLCHPLKCSIRHVHCPTPYAYLPLLSFDSPLGSDHIDPRA
ncbi:hypothetical protein GOP47_0000994, partial [Adiantum capillus-veneris]